MGIMGLTRKEGEERQAEDFYSTHPASIIPLMKLLGWENGGKYIWENSCGQGHLAEMLKLYGHKVLATDLVDRGYGIGGVNFLEPTKYDSDTYDAIIMNPPYKFAIEFIEKSIKIAPLVCAFLRITFLESSKRAQFYREHPPRFVAVFIDRMPSSKNGIFPKDESSSVCYAWFIWEKDFKGRPELLWI